MNYLFPVGEVRFTIFVTPTMKIFQCFIPKGKTIGLESLQELFNSWPQLLKSSYHKWLVLENTRWAFPPKIHIDLGLDVTKIYYVDDKGVYPIKLDNIPSINDFFLGPYEKIKYGLPYPPLCPPSTTSRPTTLTHGCRTP